MVVSLSFPKGGMTKEMTEIIINPPKWILIVLLVSLIFFVAFLCYNYIEEKYNSMSFYEIFNLFKLSEKDIEEITKMSFGEFRLLMSEHSGFEQYKLLLSFSLHKKKYSFMDKK